MWEYRIFEERDFSDNFSDIIDFDETNVEVRTDYYYDLQHNEYGLKERLSQENGDIQPKLELKIKMDETSPLGVEYWEKVISHEYPQNIDDHLSQYRIEEIIRFHSQENKEFASDIEYFYDNLNSDYRITKVTKERWESVFEVNGVMIDVEYGIVKIHGETLYSLSLESEDIDILEKLIKQWNLDKVLFKGGYPSLVEALNTMVNPELSVMG